MLDTSSKIECLKIAANVVGPRASAAEVVVCAAKFARFVMSADDNENKPVELLHLSTRAMTPLNAEGIKTVGELTSKSRRYLLNIPNMGVKSVNEIEEALASSGLFISKE